MECATTSSLTCVLDGDPRGISSRTATVMANATAAANKTATATASATALRMPTAMANATGVIPMNNMGTATVMVEAAAVVVDRISIRIFDGASEYCRYSRNRKEVEV